MFEKASRLKLRFPTAAGQLTVEDLWDLPLEKGRANLNDIACAINKQIKESQEESFVTPRSAVDKSLELQLDILKHIIKVRQDEEASRLKAKDRQEQRQRIKELIDKKKQEQDANKSLDELYAALANLDEE